MAIVFLVLDGLADRPQGVLGWKTPLEAAETPNMDRLASLGSNGLLNRGLTAALDLSSPIFRLDQSVWFILLAHVFYNYTVILRIVGSFWSNLEPEIADAARMLGASSWQIFWKITLPLLRPALFAAGLLVFHDDSAARIEVLVDLGENPARFRFPGEGGMPEVLLVPGVGREKDQLGDLVEVAWKHGAGRKHASGV